MSLNFREEKSKMQKNNLVLLSLVVLGLVMCTSAASAYTYGYGTAGYTNYAAMPYIVRSNGYDAGVRVGGFFGGNSAYIYGLRPGTYTQPCPQQRVGMYVQGCNSYSNYLGYNNYARTGGWFGYNPYSNYYGLRSGSYVFGYGNYGGNYASTPYLYHGPL
jgi:hypothetical protein